MRTSLHCFLKFELTILALLKGCTMLDIDIIGSSRFVQWVPGAAGPRQIEN